MASPLEVKLLLCDAAVADASGKVHMLGAGWSVTSSPTAPAAIAVFTEVPWDRANQKIPLVLKLLDADGQPVMLPSPAGQVGVQFEAEIEVGRPPGREPWQPARSRAGAEPSAAAAACWPLPVVAGHRRPELHGVIPGTATCRPVPDVKIPTRHRDGRTGPPRITYLARRYGISPRSVANWCGSEVIDCVVT
jgi:hypothetical protein